MIKTYLGLHSVRKILHFGLDFILVLEVALFVPVTHPQPLVSSVLFQLGLKPPPVKKTAFLQAV